MKWLWCWRCKAEMPMLDETEWVQIESLWKNGFKMTNTLIEARFRPMLEAYLQITGFHETNHLAILHHRISIYGNPCEGCGKVFRTPEAAFCAACGWIKSD